jgi:RNA polymerase sigma-70 factor (ECF subfamily)
VRDATAPNLRLVPKDEPRAPQPKPALDDAEILAAVRRGDASAAVALHDRTRPQIDRTIARLVGNGDVDRDDLAQLSMIELIHSIDRFRGECSLDTWTSRVTAHTVFKQLRRRRSERRIFDGSIDPSSSERASELDVGRDVALRSALGRVRTHLEALESSKSWTVLLHDVCGYDLQEIAEITDASVAAAQTRLVRGRRELHERIAADPELAHVLERMGVGS